MSSLEILTDLSYTLIGAAAGFIGGFSGIGGGILYVPLLDILFHAQGVDLDTSFRLAKGTSLAAIVVNSISAVSTHHGKGLVRWRVLVCAGVGGLIGSTLSSQISIAYDQNLMRAVFGVVLFGVSAQFVFYERKETGAGEERCGAPLMIFIGLISGFFSGLFGVGGGLLGVPLFLILGRFSIHRAIGTSSALVLMFALVGVLNYSLTGIGRGDAIPGAIGYVHVKAWIFVSSVSMITAYYGAKTAHRLKSKPLRLIIAAFLTVVGTRFVVMYVLSR